MPVIQIRKSQREGARVVIGLAGVSGAGKTYTALQLAYGLANERGNKVGFLDAENKRGSLYDDALPEEILIGDLFAPFSPARYVEAIRAFQEEGVEVLVIDSVSHEWEGPGGCEDIANATRFPDWRRAKAEHKRFVTALLQCDMHVIVCLRAREKVDFSDPKNPRPLGLQPIQEKNFMFEMTASLMLSNGGQSQTVLKCPPQLSGILGRGDGYLSIADGRAIRAWVDGAKQINPEVEHWRNRLQTETERGLYHLRQVWEICPPDIRRALGAATLDTLKAAAKEYDALRAAAPGAVADSVAAVNAECEGV